MALLIFSTPFFRPRLHTSMPRTTTRATKTVWITGSAVTAPNSADTPAVSRPTKSPLSILIKYRMSQPAMVV